MQSRFAFVAVGFVALAFAGVIGLVGLSGDKTTGIKSNLPPTGCISSLIEDEVIGEDSIVFIEKAKPVEGLVREALNRQRALGPADRGLEDEIRRALASLLTDNDAEKILKALSPQDQQTEFGVAALSRWAVKDLPAATLWLMQQPRQSSEQMWTVARLLAREPVVLEVLCDQVPAGAWRDGLLENSSLASLPENPGRAVLLAQRMQSAVSRNGMLTRIADDWASRDPVTSLRWIANEPVVPLRDELLSAGAAARASVDPLEAFEWTLGIANDATFEKSIGKITSMWMDFAPEQFRDFSAVLLLPGNDRAVWMPR